MAKKYSDYTEKEFLELIISVYRGGFKSEGERDAIVYEIVNASEHPDRTDILFYPSGEDSPEGVLKTIKEWRAKNGKPGFKQVE
ncbi:bacteriocin immunity protein [Mixta theicola]|uniref:Bacteriocin immunity protein n=1 Tax=Mixta theicola TaxID=1458355 RepID=A0A2K1QB71_9GAMM|nr:bacteriocin immunity protein [Mixta theicola]PNS12270.1 bacteriocin immunity protein [Mixta theicola]GLR08027.1 bacteriocin immunity protein [Mixta theicola]